MSRPIRIAHVLTSVRDGGLERVVFQLCCGLDPKRFESSICCLLDENSWSREFESRDIPFSSFGARNRGLGALLPNLRALVRLSTHLRRERIDVVIAHDFFPGVLGRISALMAGVPYRVAVLHATYDWLGGKASLVNRLLAGSTNRVVSVSEAAKASSIHREGLSSKLYRTIPNGIDPQRFRPGRPERSSIRCELGLEDGDIAIGCVGVIRESKRQSDLVQAVGPLLRADPRVRLVLVGSARPHEREYELALDSMIQSLPPGRVIRLENRHDMEAIYAAFDLFVAPSASEGFGLALTEAMASGLPCIASDIPAHTEIAGESSPFRQYPVGDVSALSERIDSLLADSNSRRNLSTLARARIEDRFTIELMLSGWDRVLTELVQEDG